MLKNNFPTANKQLLIWDLDGTLIDSFAIYAAILAEAAELSGLSMPDEQKLLHNFHGSLDDSIKNALDLVEGDAFSKVLNDFLKVQEKYYQEPESHVYKDALTLAERAQAAGCRQVLVTNRAHAGRGNASPRYLVGHSSLKKYITDIICGDEAPYRKPDSRVLGQFLGQHTYSPEAMLVVGDQFVDAALAGNLQCQAVLVNRNPEPIAHLERLGHSHDFVKVVSSLEMVAIA